MSTEPFHSALGHRARVPVPCGMHCGVHVHTRTVPELATRRRCASNDGAGGAASDARRSMGSARGAQQAACVRPVCR